MGPGPLLLRVDEGSVEVPGPVRGSLPSSLGTPPETGRAFERSSRPSHRSGGTTLGLGSGETRSGRTGVSRADSNVGGEDGRKGDSGIVGVQDAEEATREQRPTQRGSPVP